MDGMGIGHHCWFPIYSISYTWIFNVGSAGSSNWWALAIFLGMANWCQS